MANVNRYVTEHFLFSECACNHCHELIIDDLLYKHMELLELLRQEADFPIVITSGHRCTFWNKKMGGKENSMHKKFATDIKPKWVDGDTDQSIANKLVIIGVLAEDRGFGGIGVYDTFRHLDCRTAKARWSG